MLENVQSLIIVSVGSGQLIISQARVLADNPYDHCDVTAKLVSLNFSDMFHKILNRYYHYYSWAGQRNNKTLIALLREHLEFVNCF